MASIPTAPAQVGNGKAVHYVRKDEFQADTIGCRRRVSRELTEREAAGRQPCGPCQRAVDALVAEQPATPAGDAEPAAQEGQVYRQELRAEVAACTLTVAAHITAHGFQPVGERIAWTFRTGHGASARYRWVSTRYVVG
ncbi:hypothetical protein [Streptomyces sp. NPDC001068]|uniref:hypothetical protein n=1 Tax=Streptomyces sp. NPDC001068 TaxID=3364544 RepID=UPI0036899948